MKDISRNICREHCNTSYILYALPFSPSGFDINKQKVKERVELTVYLYSSYGPSLAGSGGTSKQKEYRCTFAMLQDLRSLYR